MLFYSQIYRGIFRRVYLAYNKMTREEVAIKFIKVTHDVKTDTIDKIYREEDALRVLNHPYII